MKPIKLLARPRWVEGESWAGYLLRLANANEIAGIPALARLLGSSSNQLQVAQPREALASLGVDASRAPRLKYSAARIQSSRAGPDNSPRQREPLVIKGRRAGSAICPPCLASDSTPHIRAIWERPLEIGCRVHGNHLVTHCASCGHKLMTTRPFLLECPCGARLPGQATTKVELDWAALLPAFSVRRRQTADETFQPTSYPEILASSVVERIALYERQHAPAPRKQRVSIKPSVDDIRLALPWFMDWPRQFERRYLEALERGRHVDGEHRTSYVQAKTLFAPMFPRLHRAVRRVAYQSKLRPGTSIERSVEDHLTCANQSIPSTAKLLCISRASVCWLAGTGALPGAIRLSKHAIEIPTESVLDLMALFVETQDWQAAADQHGIGHSAMRELMRAGLIPATSLGAYGESRVEPDAWTAFAEFLLGVSQPLPARFANPTLSIDAVIAASQRPTPDPDRTARIIDAIATGMLPVYFRRRKPDKLRDLLVSISELKMVAQRDA